ncbi:MAG: hypothetical protein Q8N05_09010 [Bacteroidota bacterium]|nr:hypothetical protein [Bacteroidota bacterium]
MENFKFQKSLNDQGLINGLDIEGMLVLENSQQIKTELVGILSNLSDQVKITIRKPENLDLSCIQLFVAFIKRIEELNIVFQIIWDLDEDQELLLENAGLGYELFKTNLYA